MSRFYDALTEASRIRQDSDPTGFGNRDFPDVEIPPVQTPLEADSPAPEEQPESIRVEDIVPDVAVELEALRTSSFLEASPEDQLEANPEAHLEASPEAQPNGFSGVQIAVTLDRKARLIPHAIDASVVEHYRKLRTK